MDIQKGDRVLVNLAPFIGSVLRCDESISCEVVDVEGIRVHVRAEPPYREASLWVLNSWIDSHRQQKEKLLEAAGMAD
jgi:hypothetical protein